MNSQEVNEAVARKLNTLRYGDPGMICGSCIPRYCNDIKAAWDIPTQFPMKKHLVRDHGPEDCWFRLERNESGFLAAWSWWCYDYYEDIAEAQAETAPLAICEAFLKLEDK